MPLFVLLLAHFVIPAERMTRLKLFGILFGIGSVAVIFSHQIQGADSLAAWGSAAILVADALEAIASVFIRKLRDRCLAKPRNAREPTSNLRLVSQILHVFVQRVNLTTKVKDSSRVLDDHWSDILDFVGEPGTLLPVVDDLRVLLSDAGDLSDR